MQKRILRHWHIPLSSTGFTQWRASSSCKRWRPRRVNTAHRAKLWSLWALRLESKFSLWKFRGKVVLLCKFSLYLYRAVRAPIGARALRLQPHKPHGWSGLTAHVHNRPFTMCCQKQLPIWTRPSQASVTIQVRCCPLVNQFELTPYLRHKQAAFWALYRMGKHYVVQKMEKQKVYCNNARRNEAQPWATCNTIQYKTIQHANSQL